MPQSVRLNFVGDICPGDKTIPGIGVHSVARKFGYDHFFTQVAKRLAEADFCIGNLEGPIAAIAESGQAPVFCGMPSIARSLKNHNFGIVTIANNHIMQCGPGIFSETISHLEAEGLAVCGKRNGTEFYSNLVTVTLKGLTIGFLAYNWIGVNVFPGADAHIAQSRGCVNYTWFREKDQGAFGNENVLSDIKKAKQRVDFLILLPHWGFEYVPYPPQGVRREASRFLEQGVDLIVGSHPHVLQGMEQFNQKWVFYSLGNFLFDSAYPRSRSSGILQIKIQDGNVSDYTIIYTNSESDYQIVPASQRRIHALRDQIDFCNSMLQSNSPLLDDNAVYRKFEREYRAKKWQGILLHFIKLPRHPIVFRTIMRKFFAALGLIMDRLRGKRVRW